MFLSRVVTLMTIISFLWSGLTINLLQAINYLLLRRLNFTLFARVNYYLIYSVWSQIVALFDWFFGGTFTVYHAKEEDEPLIFKEHQIFLANHSYELDWVGAWMVTEKFGQLANCKAMLKSDLKYIPIVGWSWSMSDQLFLDRNWEKDKHKFQSSIDTLLKYDPMVATFFLEGTRMTREKNAECQKFAAERGLVAPKYHLIPRTKGMVEVSRQLKRRQAEDPNLKVFIYQAQVAYEPTGAMNIGDILKKGLKPRGHIYFERIPFSEIPEDEEGCAKWIQDLYVKKDDLQDYFNKHNRFPGHVDSIFKNYRGSYSSLCNWIFWQIYTIVPIVYMMMCVYYSYGTVIVSMVISTLLLLSYVYLNYIMYQADLDEEVKVNKNKAM